MRRARQQGVTFRAIDATLYPALKSGLLFVAGDTKISKDLGAFVNTTNPPVEIGTTGVYGLTLTAAETDALWIHVEVTKALMQPASVAGGTTGEPSGTVVSDVGNTSLTFKTDLSGASNSWKDAFVVFTSGALLDQVHKVTGYDGSSKFLTFTTAFGAPPSAGDRFLIVNK